LPRRTPRRITTTAGRTRAANAAGLGEAGHRIKRPQPDRVRHLTRIPGVVRRFGGTGIPARAPGPHASLPVPPNPTPQRIPETRITRTGGVRRGAQAEACGYR
jgi:hypothetical protein